MSSCRICLTILGDKGMDANQLPKDLEESKSYSDIIVFCLNIQILPNPDLRIKLCEACYYKIIDYYEFKVQAQKNDSYWESIQNNNSTLIKREISSDNESYESQNAFDIKNGIQENTGASEDMQSDDQLLGVIEEIKYAEFIKDVNKNEPAVYDHRTGKNEERLSEPRKKRFKKKMHENKEIVLAATSKPLPQTNSNIQTDDSIEPNINSAQNLRNKLLIDTIKTMYYLYLPSID